MAGSSGQLMLSGHVVVVTGGSRGIGRACVLHAAAHGAHVVFCSRTNGEESREVERSAAGLGAEGVVVGVAADVSDEQAISRLFRVARERFGAVHGVVHNAAVVRHELLVSATTDDWDAVIESNLTGGFLVVREALRAFLATGLGGQLVVIGTLSQFGVSGNISYAVSKGGLLGLVRAVSRQYAHRGVGANMIVPGYVETALSEAMSETARRALIDGCPMRRPGSPDEIAGVVSHLLSPAAAGVDGQAIFVTGGLREVPL